MPPPIKLLLLEDLSPHKIALLFVLVLYATNKIPEQSLKEVLLVIIQLLENEPLCDATGAFIIVPQLTDLCHALGNAVCKDESDSTQVAAWAELQRLLLHLLWRINSVESLNTYIINTFQLLLNPLDVCVEKSDTKLISPRSFIGDFIQKIVTTFRLLHFDEEFLLYEALVEYRELSRLMYTACGGQLQDDPVILPRKSHNATRKAMEPTTKPGRANDADLYAKLNHQLQGSIGVTVSTPTHKSEANGRLIPVPKHDFQALLDKQVSLLETYGTETPEFLRQIMTIMASPDANTCAIQNVNFNNLPLYHYLRYLENLHECDYHGAFEALHQYFDYMVSKSSKYFYHFALISRASLHQYFGEDEKAIDAIEEAISVARENKDNATLTYILLWLFNFIRNKPHLWNTQNFYQNNNEHHLLDFLIKKSQLVSLSLFAMSHHFELAHIMNTGGSPTKYLESLVKGMYVSLNDELATFIKSTEMAATVWHRIGVPALSDVYSDLSLEYARSIGKLGDELSIDIRRNYLLHSKGHTEEAYKNLENARSKLQKDHSLFKALQIRSLIMLVKIDLRKGRSKYAEQVTKVLESIDIHDIELRTELEYLKVEVQVALHNYSKALCMISATLTQSQLTKIHSNSHTVLRLNLLKGSIFNAAGSPARALSLVIQQIQRGRDLGFVSIVIEGLILLGLMFNNMSAASDAYRLFERLMPKVLSVNNQEFTCLAYYEFARSCLLLIEAGDDNRKQLFNNCLRFLLLSITGAKASLNLVLLRRCFELEERVGAVPMESLALEELRDHSRLGLEILNKRTVQEADYGFVVSAE